MRVNPIPNSNFNKRVMVTVLKIKDKQVALVRLAANANDF